MSTIPAAKELAAIYRTFPGSFVLTPGSPLKPLAILLDRTGQIPCTLVISPNIRISDFGRPYTNAEWNCLCLRCSAKFIAKSEPIRRQYRSTLTCGCSPKIQQQRKSRSLTFSTRQPAQDLRRRRFGDFKVIAWIDRQGWECECKHCGGHHFIRRTSQITLHKYTQCPERKLRSAVANA